VSIVPFLRPPAGLLAWGPVAEAAQDRPRGATKLFYRDSQATEFRRRLREILRLSDLRPTDRVLDVGCAEGWITLELASRVGHVHGFDPSVLRIDEAQRLAQERGIENATFEVGSVVDYPLEPLSYDVTMFSAVWGARGVGFKEFERLLHASRRQLVARMQIASEPERVPEIYDVCGRNDFDVLCFPRKFVVAVRRGTDCRIPQLPMLTVVPTSQLEDHEIVQMAEDIADTAGPSEQAAG
jgi:SAM-dependent methyltransferase